MAVVLLINIIMLKKTCRLNSFSKICYQKKKVAK